MGRTLPRRGCLEPCRSGFPQCASQPRSSRRLRLLVIDGLLQERFRKPPRRVAAGRDFLQLASAYRVEIRGEFGRGSEICVEGIKREAQFFDSPAWLSVQALSLTVPFSAHCHSVVIFPPPPRPGVGVFYKPPALMSSRGAEVHCHIQFRLAAFCATFCASLQGLLVVPRRPSGKFASANNHAGLMHL
jgi:hypothetical protein